jgi:hypothetical protein
MQKVISYLIREKYKKKKIIHASPTKKANTHLTMEIDRGRRKRKERKIECN